MPTSEKQRDRALMYALYAMPVLFMAYMMASDLSERARLNNIETRMNLVGARVSQNASAVLDHERRMRELEGAPR